MKVFVKRTDPNGRVGFYREKPKKTAFAIFYMHTNTKGGPAITEILAIRNTKEEAELLCREYHKGCASGSYILPFYKEVPAN